MPVCITGMHRSGTSLVANLLCSCGLYMGEAEDMMPATVDNPKGYWENRKFLNLNDEILSEFGGDWESPPAITDGWADDDRLNQLRAKAEILLRDFLGREPWGWKDPRNSLTLPFWETLSSLRLRFWQGVAPKLKIVLCLRNPLEVSRSLETRTFTPNESGLALWLAYNQSILNSVLPEDRIITHYEAYFHDPQAELRRVLQFLNMKVADDLINQSVSEVSDSMRRNQFRGAQLLEAGTPSEVVTLYQDLCQEANYFKPLGAVHN